MNRHCLYFALLTPLVLSATPLGAQANPDSVRMRNDCRLAAQVLTLGQPAVRRDWALGLIDNCGAEGGQVLAALLRQYSDVNTWNDELDQIVNTTAFIVDAAIFEAAMDVAVDPAAGTVARVQSIRALASQVSPGYLVPYRAFAEPERGAYSGLTEINARAEPLPREFSIRTEDAMRGILASEGLPDVVRKGAGRLQNMVVTQLYCDDTMSIRECLDVIISKTRG